MINTTDLSEFEVLLPGDWVRRDSGAIYSFTTDNMSLRDERLFRQLYIAQPGAGGGRTSVPYALTIENSYCGIIAGDEKFIITRIAKHPDGSMDMEWRDKANALIGFHREG
jgi:hypothetical protein